MKNRLPLITASLIGSLTLNMQAQVYSPILESSTNVEVPASSSVYCEDYDSFGSVNTTFAYSSVAEKGIVSISESGEINAIITELGMPALIYGPILNLGASSCVMFLDSELVALRISFVDNISCSETDGYDVPLPAGYNQATVLGFVFHTVAPNQYQITTMLKVFSTVENKWKVLALRSVVNNLGDTATHEFKPIMVGSVATYGADITIDPVGNVYIWGYYSKNAAGTQHDNFLTKYNASGILQYTKTFSSYTGRDDIASRVVLDNAGGLYAISLSEDNVSPYYDHIAIYKIKTLNGKLTWIKRQGEATEGDEHMWDVAGNTTGEGLAFTGSFVTPAGSRDTRTWRLNGAGNAMWIKTINQNPIVGSTEEGRAICFDAVTGDVMVGGFTQNNAFIERYNTSTGVAAWPVKLYAGAETGTVLNNKMIITSRLTGDDLLLFPSAIPGGNNLITVAIFNEIILKEAAAENNNTIQIYPNPANNFIQIKGLSQINSIQIINAVGQIIETVQNPENTISIATSDFEPGMYFVQAGDVTYSFIITH
ncbi:MAG: T9SS type A sorting domain-containing protein [Chitinophagales bacterium]